MAAYRAGTLIIDDKTGKKYDYTKKQGVDHSEILSPISVTTANRWITDRSQLWNKVEATEKRVDAQLTRELIIAIPRELDRADQIALVREYAKSSYVDRGMIADLNLHHLDSDNPHAHVMLTMRELQIDEQGIVSFGSKDRSWNDKKLLETQVKEWEVLANQYLERAGLDTRIDSRSYEEQGVERIPQIHLGKDVASMRKKGIPTERGDLYDQIDRANAEIRSRLEEIYQAESAIKDLERDRQRQEKANKAAARAEQAERQQPTSREEDNRASLETIAKLPQTRTREIDLAKIIGNDQANRIVEWAQKILIIPDGELEAKINSPTRPVQISARLEQLNSSSIDYVLTDLTTNEQLEISCQRWSGRIQSITGTTTASIAEQIAAINNLVLTGRLEQVEIVPPPIPPTVSLESPLPKPATAQVEKSPPVVTPKPVPVAKTQDPAEYNQRLKQEAAKQRTQAHLLYTKQIADLKALPKQGVFNWRGLSEDQFNARKAAIKQEHQKRLAEIERILAKNLKPIPKLTQQEINEQAKAKTQQTMQEYREREAVKESQQSEAERSERERMKATQAHSSKPKPSPKRDMGRH